MAKYRYPTPTLGEYRQRLSRLSDANIGDLFDDWFSPEEDPMDRDLRIEMLYGVIFADRLKEQGSQND